MTTDLVSRPLAAALCMVAAMSVIGVIDNYIAPMAAHIGLWQFHFTRALIAIPIILGLSLIGLGTIWPARLGAVALRSLLVAVSMLFYFTALALMPIAQALAGLFTSPIFILLITGLAMGQKIGPWRIGSVAVGFLGIVMVLQPDPANFDMLTLLPVAGGLFYALGAITTRALCSRESTVAMLLGMWITLGTMGAVGITVLALVPMEAAPGAAGFVTRGWEWPMWDALPYVALQAVGSVVGVFLIIRAYQWGEPSFVGVFEYSVMIFGPVYAFVVFGQGLGPWQILGIGLIALAGAAIAFRSA